MKLSRTVAAGFAAVLLLTAAGCGDDDGNEPDDDVSTSASPNAQESTPSDEATTPTPSASATPREASGPPFPANTERDTQKQSGNAALTVTDIRIGRDAGFDRVVYELAGRGKPGWLVAYTDDPAADPEGTAVKLPGDGDLQVIIRGLTFPPDQSLGAYDGPDKIRGQGTGEISVVWWGGVFEGQAQSVIGVDDDDHPFRVFSLKNPTRVVVDIRDDD